MSPQEGATRSPQRAAAHVAYELGMLRVTLQYSIQHDALDIVALEAFLLHTRNLLEFFYDGSSTGAILPKDFGAPRARDKSATSADLRDEISQLVSHLTWDRVVKHELRTQDWSNGRLQRIHDDIKVKAAAFFAAIPQDSVEWFSSPAFPHEYRYWTDNPLREPAT